MLDREQDGIYTTTHRGVVIGALTRAQVADAVECYECHAPRGSVCRGHDKPHASRRTEAMRLYGLVPPQAVLSNNNHIDKWYKEFRKYAKDPESYNARKHRRQRRREESKPTPASSVSTRFVCPVCGGPHARADHPPAPTGLIRLSGKRRIAS